MIEPLAQLETRLLSAARARTLKRRRRRRRLTLGAAAAGALLAAASATSAVSGEGPIADVLGVERDDPTLRTVHETAGAPRGVVRLRGDDGHLYTFAAFHAEALRGERVPSICFAQTRDDAKRIPGLGCTTPAYLARDLRRTGIVGGSQWANARAGSLRVTKTAVGLVPADARSVTFEREGGAKVRAVLSKPFSIGLGQPTRPASMRAFLAVGSYDADGPEWLGRPARETIAVVAGDGTTQRRRSRDPSFFPMTRTVRPAEPPIVMHLAAWPAPWRSIGYVGAEGTLCTAAAPRGERLIKPTLLQCSSPLAVVNGLKRFGAAVYLSNSNPRRERGRRSMAAFGFARADAVAVALVNQTGRRFQADLSRPWATAVRRPGDLAGVRGPLRRRLAALPRRIRLRSYITSLSLPPGPDRGRGLRLEVRLRDGTVLRTAGR